MPDPTLDDLTRDWKVVRAVPPPQARLDDIEQKRLDALAKPWPVRPFAYFDWLTSAMPDPKGDILFGCVVVLGVFVCGGLTVGLVLLALSPASWIVWFLLGAVIGKFAVWLLRSAAATELRYRRSLAEKMAQKRDD